MPRFARNWFHATVPTRLASTHLAARRLAAALLAILTIFSGSLSGRQEQAQPDNALPNTCEGSLYYRSPISGRYESVPLVHTDATIDVRGLAAAATVTQQYVNSGSEPIEAIYVFPLPHDAAVRQNPKASAPLWLKKNARTYSPPPSRTSCPATT